MAPDGDRQLERRPADRAFAQRLLRVLGSAGAALMLVVIVSSAWLRLTQAGLSCSDWPACYGRVDPDAVVTTGVLLARLAHRITASAVGIVLLAAVLITVTQRPWLKRQTAIAAATLAIALGLAVLGAQFPTASAIPAPAVVLANLGGGFGLLALLWLLRQTTLPPPVATASAWLRLAAALALLAVIAQIGIGALVSAKFAALACPGFPACGADWPAGALRDSLDPFAGNVSGPGGAIVRPLALAALHFAHRIGAAIVIVLIAAVTGGLAAAGDRARRFGVMVLGLALAQGALGAAAVVAQLPLAAVVAHNAIAALLLAALAVLNYRVNVSEAGA